MLPPAFSQTQFFPSKPEAKNAYSSISLWGEHLEPGERVRSVIMLRSSTVLLTDRRLLELTPHMDDFGFWNVRRFEGYERTLELPTASTALVGWQDLEKGCRLGLRDASGEHTLLLEPWRQLTMEHIDKFLGILRESLGAAPRVP